MNADKPQTDIRLVEIQECLLKLRKRAAWSEIREYPRESAVRFFGKYTSPITAMTRDDGDVGDLSSVSD
jgi:hypothetical protein